jgi:hypothetical protein
VGAALATSASYAAQMALVVVAFRRLAEVPLRELLLVDRRDLARLARVGLDALSQASRPPAAALARTSLAGARLAAWRSARSRPPGTSLACGSVRGPSRGIFARLCLAARFACASLLRALRAAWSGRG